jgi:hypothetical protein
MGISLNFFNGFLLQDTNHIFFKEGDPLVNSHGSLLMVLWLLNQNSEFDQIHLNNEISLDIEGNA